MNDSYYFSSYHWGSHHYESWFPSVSAPVAVFTLAPTFGAIPLVVSFTDTSTGSINSWSWVFGDGATSTEQNPTHTYQTVGTYTITLTVTAGLFSSTATAEITTAKPLARLCSLNNDFTWNKGSQNVSVWRSGSLKKRTTWRTMESC